MKRLFFAFGIVLLWMGTSFAALSLTQLQALKADIAASEFSGLPHGPEEAATIAKAYNEAASPSFTVWKTNVTVREIGDKMNGAELAGLSSLNHTRLLTVITMSTAGVNPSLADRRAFFDDIFSGAGGATTRANLLILWKRLATRVEQLFATGTGSDASPATLVFEGAISYTDVLAAWNS